MKRKQQFLKTASIFEHKYNQKPFNIIIINIRDKLKTKALYLAYNLPDDIFWNLNLNLTEEISEEEEKAYYAMLDRHDYRHRRKLIRRGRITQYGNKKYHNREWRALGTDKELKKYLKKCLKEGRTKQ